MDTRLNPTDGHLIAGVKINDHQFLGRLKATQLFQIAPNPRDAEDRKKVDASKELQDLREIRDEVQRLFAGAKAKNVPGYADYIVEVHAGEADGITPPIILYSEDELAHEIDLIGVIDFIEQPIGDRPDAGRGSLKHCRLEGGIQHLAQTRAGHCAVHWREKQ